MKQFLLAVGMLGVILAVNANESSPAAVGQDGSNATGTERSCKLESGKSFDEALKNCRRGDIIHSQMAITDVGAAMACDFTKQFFFEGGFLRGCVYSGTQRRAIQK